MELRTRTSKRQTALLASQKIRNAVEKMGDSGSEDSSKISRKNIVAQKHEELPSKEDSKSNGKSDLEILGKENVGKKSGLRMFELFFIMLERKVTRGRSKKTTKNNLYNVSEPLHSIDSSEMLDTSDVASSSQVSPVDNSQNTPFFNFKVSEEAVKESMHSANNSTSESYFSIAGKGSDISFKYFLLLQLF